MFHHQKFSKNAFCKNALLNSTSFSPLSYWRKLLDMAEQLSASKQSKKRPRKYKLKAEVSITPLLAALLAACSDTTYVPVGGTLDGTNVTTPTGDETPALPFNLYVLDGAVEGALVYVDENANGQRDEDENEEPIGTTDENGRVSIEAEYAGETFFIDASGALDLFTGARLPNNTFYRAISEDRGGADVVASPISTVIEALKDSDPAPTDAEILAIIFGANTQVDMDDLNNPDNFILPISDTEKPTGSPGAIAEEIASTSIQLQALIEQHGGDLAAVLAAIGESFDVTDDLNQTSQDTANARIAEARERAGGDPIANPVTGTTATLNSDLTLEVDVWGFRDPVGNRDGDSSFMRLDIGSITDGSGMLVHIADDDIETEYGAGGEIPAEHFANLVFRPVADYLGRVEIIYTVFDGEDDSDEASLEIEVISDPNAPMFLSDAPTSADENVAFNDNASEQGNAVSIYEARAESTNGDVTYSLAGTDAALFGINSTSGDIWFRTTHNYEAENNREYSFRVVARVIVNGVVLTTEQAVTLTIADVNDAPTLTATATGTIAENAPSQADTGVTLTPDDEDGDTFDAVTSFTIYEGASGTTASTRFGVIDDNGVFRLVLLDNSTLDSVNASAITLRVVVSDNSGADSNEVSNEVTVTITVTVTDIDANAPVFTSDGSPPNQDENIAANDNASEQASAVAIYEARAESAGGDVTYSLAGTDAALFGIDAEGDIWFRASPDHESGKTSYSFTVVASVTVNDVELTTEQAVTLDLNDLNDSPPEFSSGDTASASATVAVNDDGDTQGSAATIYTAIATPDDAGDTVVYSLASADTTTFGINASTGDVWFKTAPDYTTNSSYSFTVTASVTADGMTQTATQTVMVSANATPTITLGDTDDLVVSDAGSVYGKVIVHGIEFTAKPGTNPSGIKFTESNSGLDVDFFIRMDSEYDEFFIYDPRTDSERVYTRDSIIAEFNVEDQDNTRYEAALVEAGTGSVTISFDDLINGGDGSGFFATPLVETAADLAADGTLEISDLETSAAELKVFIDNEDTDSDSTTTEIAHDGSADTIVDNISGDGSYGSFTFTRTPDGGVSWTYALDDTNSTVNALDVGETATDSVWVRVEDDANSTVEQITVTIAGANDAPTLSGTETAEIPENSDAETDTGVTLTPADVDVNTTFDADSFTVYEGDIASTRFGVIDDNGVFRLVLRANNPLNFETEQTINLRVVVSDGALTSEAVDVTVTVTDVDDAPTITLSATDDLSISEGTENTPADLAAAGTLEISDAETSLTELQVFIGETADEVLTVIALGGFALFSGNNNAYSGFVFARATSGEVTWTYDALDDAALNALGAGETATDSVWVRVNDGNSDSEVQEIKVTINGVNDAPTLNVDGSETPFSFGGLIFTPKDGTNPAGVKIVIMTSDILVDPVFTVDTSDNTDVVTLTSQHVNNGNISIGNIVSAFDGNSNSRYTVTYDTGYDGFSTILVNDLPDVIRVSDLSVTPGAGNVPADLNAGGALVFGDVDDDDTLTSLDVFVGNTDSPATALSVSAASGEILGNNGYGNFTFTRAASGEVTWAYILDESAVNGLVVGETLTDSVWVRVNDGNSDSPVRELAVTITGSSNPPTVNTAHADYGVTDTYESGDLEAASGRWVVEGGGGTALSYDVQAQGDYGTLRFGTDGNWGYAIDTMHSDIRNLNDPGNPTTLTDTITVRATDEDGEFVDGTVTVTINDAINTLYVNRGSGDDGSNSDYVGSSSSTTEQIVQGGGGTDFLQGGTADDILIGGAGNDTISLNHGGSDTVIYRIASTDGGLVGSDGNDTIDNLNFSLSGIDSLVFVDTDDTPLGSFADLLELGMGNDPQLTVSLIPQTGDTGYSGMVFTFLGDTTTSTDDATLTLNFKDTLIATGANGVFGTDGIDTNNQLTDEGFLRFSVTYGNTYDVVALEEFGIEII